MPTGTMSTLTPMQHDTFNAVATSLNLDAGCRRASWALYERLDALFGSLSASLKVCGGVCGVVGAVDEPRRSRGPCTAGKRHPLAPTGCPNALPDVSTPFPAESRRRRSPFPLFLTVNNAPHTFAASDLPHIRMTAAHFPALCRAVWCTPAGFVDASETLHQQCFEGFSAGSRQPGCRESVPFTAVL